METQARSSGKQSPLSGTRTRLALALGCVAAVTLGSHASAQAQVMVLPGPTAESPPLIIPMPPPPWDLSPTWTPPVEPLPDHFTVDHRRFDTDVAGLRAYAETVRSSDPKLYAKLAPDVARLESSAHDAEMAAVAGAGVGAAAFVACYAGNGDQMSGCGLIGLASTSIIGLLAMAMSPNPQDILDVLKKAGAGVSF